MTSNTAACTTASAHSKSQTVRNFVTICFAIFFLSGCSTLGESRINTDPAQAENMIDALDQANRDYAAQNWSEAEKGYRKIIVMMEKDEFSYFRLGNTLLRQGKLEEAVTEFKMAIQLNPQFTEARHNLATCFMLLADAQMGILETMVEPGQQKAARNKRALLQKAAAEKFK